MFLPVIRGALEGVSEGARSGINETNDERNSNASREQTHKEGR